MVVPSREMGGAVDREGGAVDREGGAVEGDGLSTRKLPVTL
jgi:hypothetical protein